MKRRPLLALVVLLASALSSREAGAQATPDVGDTVRIEMEEGAVEGVLVDRVPSGYLVRTGAGTQVVAYEKVHSIVRVGVEASTPAPPTPEPTTAPEPPAPAATAAPEATGPAAPPEEHAIDRWSFLRVHYLVGILPHLVYSGVVGGNRANNSGVDSDIELMLDATQDFADWLSIGVDATLAFTDRRVVDPGQEGCEFLGGCYPYEDGLSHETITTMFTLWGKPFYSFGDLRVWGGLGFNLAIVFAEYLTDAGIGWQGTDVDWSIGAGAGGDYLLRLSRAFGLVGSLSLLLGSPVYDEEIENFPAAGNTYRRSAVGHAVFPWRLGIGVGIAMGSASQAPPPQPAEAGGDTTWGKPQ